MSDHDDAVALLVHLGDFHMNFSHQGARRIVNRQVASPGFFFDGFRNAVRREHEDRTVGHFVDFVHKNRTLFSQGIDDMFVVNDFMADVNRRAVHCKCSFNDRNRTVNTGAEASWLGQQNFHNF